MIERLVFRAHYYLPLLILVLVSACSTINYPAQREVTIHRDVWGVPHIYSDREEDGFYGLGYAQAEDKLIGLLGAIYWVNGRRSELEGDALLAADIEQRRWRHADEGRAGLARLDPQVQLNYKNFVDGLKRYMIDHPDQVPDWAPEFDVADFVSINRAIFWSAYAGILGPAECRVPDVKLEASLQSVSDAQLRGASNGWVLAPARTANGATILLADPHTELQSPAYYEYTMHAGNLHASGFALGPLLWQSHNLNVSWAMTTGNPDMWDCYAVEVDPNNPVRYKFDGEWRDMVEIDEVFEVSGGEPVSRTFTYTNHNGVLSPVVAREGNIAYAVSASQMHDTGLLDNEIWHMVHANSVFDLRDAMSTLGMFPQNIIAGDSEGNLYYLRAGKTPKRVDGFDWTATVPGNTSATLWRGYYTLDEMVEILNPAQGYLQNNNVAPDAMFAQDNMSASHFPPEVFNDTPGRVTSRGLRSVSTLSNSTQFTIGDAKALAFDEMWISTEFWVSALRYALGEQSHWLAEQDDETRAFVQRLNSFDGMASSQSVAALNFYYWRGRMPDVLLRPEFEHLRTLPWQTSDFNPQFATAILQQAAHAAAQMLVDHGTTNVEMGTVFRIGRGADDWPIGGETIEASSIPDCVADYSPLCERTMRAFASGRADTDGHRSAYRGSQSMRLVELGASVKAWSLHVYGQSDDPQSPHYNDQSALASERQFKPTFFDWQDLKDNIEVTTQLVLGPE